MTGLSRFQRLLSEIAADIEGRALDEQLADILNERWAANGPTFVELKQLCMQGQEEGWLVAREAGGIRFGRPIKPGSACGGFSVDVVRMKDIRGPHHVHPNGEIGAIFAVEGNPKFDGFPEGWYVYGPGTDHFPTVTGGDAFVLYLLPEGAIEFTGRQR